MTFQPNSNKLKLQCTNCPNNLTSNFSEEESKQSITSSSNKILNFIELTVQDNYLSEFINNSNFLNIIFNWFLISLKREEDLLEELDSNKNLNTFSKCVDKITDEVVYVTLRDNLAEKSIDKALDTIIEKLKKVNNFDYVVQNLS